MKLFRDIRVIPMVLAAVFGLAMLKVAGLVIDGGYVFDYQSKPAQSKPARKSWLQGGSFNLPTAEPDAPEITGAVKKDDGPSPAPAAPEVVKPDSGAARVEQNPQVSPSERAILERLQSRRQELDARARELEIRESLLKAAEKRIETRVEELKAVEARIAIANGQKSEAEAARLKGLVTMYENMKPKEAAKVFDRLEMSVLFEVASQIAPRKMSEILGVMTPEAAERLTVEMARHAGADKSAEAADLPKIEGKPLPQKPN